MNDLKTLLENVAERVSPRDDAFDRLAVRRTRRHRHQRIGAGMLAMLVAAAGVTVAVSALGGGSASLGERQIRVPNVQGIRVGDARAILSRLGLKASVDRVPSQIARQGFVVGENPPTGSLSAGSTLVLDVSAGPGPASSGPEAVLARGIVIRLTHTGRYERHFPAVPPRSEVVGPKFQRRVIGRAHISAIQIIAGQSGEGNTSLRYVFSVDRLSRPAWLLILSIRGQISRISFPVEHGCGPVPTRIVTAATDTLKYMGAIRVRSVWYVEADGRTISLLIGERPGPKSKDIRAVLLVMNGRFVFGYARRPLGAVPPQGPVAVAVLDPSTLQGDIFGIQTKPIDLSKVPGANCIPLSDVGWAIHG